MNVNRPATVKIDDHTTSNSYCEKLLSVKIDSQLNFNHNFETIKKARQKAHVLARITPYLCISKRKLLLNAFPKARFSSILVTEMFKLDKKMSTELIQGLFCVRQTRYNFRNPYYFAIPSINSVCHGSKRTSNLGPRIWNLVPDRLKEI